MESAAPRVSALQRLIMEKITINNALPRVFAGREATASEVWEQPQVELHRGKFYIISAESGTGKSSLCSYIYGFRTDYSGRIAMDDTDVSTFTVAQWCDVRRSHISYLPQDLKLFAELTALENVQLKNRLSHHKSEKEITELFGLLGIADKLHQPCGKLSIGQQQRVAIIRALCQPCDFYLLDEPVSHLDEGNNRLVSGLFTDEARRQGAGIIATSVGNHLLINADKTLKL